MFRTLLVIFCVFAASTSASLAAEEEEFSRHLVGCWQHGKIPPSAGELEEMFMTQTCFKGGVEGEALYFTCHGFGTFDCWDGAERYALRDNKLHFISGRAERLCDAEVVPGETLRLYNCNGAEASFAERIYVRVVQP